MKFSDIKKWGLARSLADQIKHFKSGSSAEKTEYQSLVSPDRWYSLVHDFGAVADGITDNLSAVNAAGASGKRVLWPDGIVYCSGVPTISAPGTQFIGLVRPSVDWGTGLFASGSRLKGRISAPNSVAVQINGLGIDARGLAEGMEFANATNLTLRDITVLATSSNNHCCLVQVGRGLNVKGFTSIGGTQGLAVKVVDFVIEDVESYDTDTYGFTLRHDVNACHAGYVRNIKCRNLFKPAGAGGSGGPILMNDGTEGSALRNLRMHDIIVDGCKAGFFISNTGNATPATDIEITGLTVKNVADFAWQSFGPISDITLADVSFENVAGGFTTNGAAAQRLQISNYRERGCTYGSNISGSGHKFTDWRKTGTSNISNFGTNTSTDLQLFGMDKTLGQYFSDAGGGTQIETDALLTAPAVGSLPAIKLQNIKTAKLDVTLAQNATATLVTLPDANSACDLWVEVISEVGLHVARYAIAGRIVMKVVGSQWSELNFDVVMSGNNIQIKSLGVSTGGVSVTAFYQVMTAA